MVRIVDNNVRQQEETHFVFETPTCQLKQCNPSSETLWSMRQLLRTKNYYDYIVETYWEGNTNLLCA